MMADLSIQNEGNIYILRALTDAGKQWVAEHIPADAKTWSIDGVVVAPSAASRSAGQRRAGGGVDHRRNAGERQAVKPLAVSIQNDCFESVDETLKQQVAGRKLSLRRPHSLRVLSSEAVRNAFSTGTQWL
jgi:hypothetical protein